MSRPGSGRLRLLGHRVRRLAASTGCRGSARPVNSRVNGGRVAPRPGSAPARRLPLSGGPVPLDRPWHAVGVEVGDQHLTGRQARAAPAPAPPASRAAPAGGRRSRSACRWPRSPHRPLHQRRDRLAGLPVPSPRVRASCGLDAAVRRWLGVRLQGGHAARRGRADQVSTPYAASSGTSCRACRRPRAPSGRAGPSSTSPCGPSPWRGAPASTAWSCGCSRRCRTSVLVVLVGEPAAAPPCTGSQATSSTSSSGARVPTASGCPDQ